MWEWRTIARSPALSSTGMANGEEVKRAVEVPGLKLEIGGDDSRREAVVEGGGEAQPLVHAVPAQLYRDLVGAQLAGVEEAEHLDPGEVCLAEPAELLSAVLADVPGVVGLLRTRRREGEQVRRRDVGDAVRGQHRAEVVEDRARVLDVLDRLQEDNGV